MVAAIVLIAGVAAVLAAVFRTASPRASTSQPGTQSAGFALATPSAAIINEAFNSDPGALWAYQQGLGVHPNLIQQVNGFQVTLTWVYADANRVIYLLTTSDFLGRQTRGLEFDSSHFGVTITDQAGQLVKTQEGYGTGGAQGGVAYDGGALEIDPDNTPPTQITIHLSASAFEVWNPIPAPATPSACKEFGTTYSCPTPITGQLDFTTSVPVLAGHVIQFQQQGTVDGTTLMLQRVAITPSQVRIDLDQEGGTISHGTGAEALLDFYPMRLTSDGREALGGFSQSVEGQHYAYVFNDSFAQQPGDYTLTIQPQRSSVSEDVAPPPNSWVVRFTVPPATKFTATPNTILTPPSTASIPIPKIFRGNSDAAALMTARLGVFPNQSIHSGALTVTLVWSYADAERVYAYYTASGLPSLSTAVSSATELCPARLSFTPTPSGTSIDASGAAVDGNTLECYVEEPADSTPLGSSMTATLSLAGSASVTAHVPVLPARVGEPHETAEVNGQSVTLNRVMVTPSGLLLDFSSPGAGAGEWRASFNGWNPEVDSWGSEITSGPPYACACYYPGASLPGPWTIKLTHSMNTSNQLGQATVDPDQTATFTVTLPPASWNQPQVVVPSPTPVSTPNVPVAPPSPPPPATPTASGVKSPTVFDDFPEAQRVFAEGLGNSMTTQQQVGPAIVRLRWAYADMNEVFALYTIQNRAQDPTATGQSPPADPSNTCPGQLEIGTSGVTTLGQTGRENIDAPGSQAVDCLIGITTGWHSTTRRYTPISAGTLATAIIPIPP